MQLKSAFVELNSFQDLSRLIVTAASSEWADAIMGIVRCQSTVD
jgi:hypothetical protein